MRNASTILLLVILLGLLAAAGLAGMLMQACRLLANSFVPTITLRWGSARSPR